MAVTKIKRTKIDPVAVASKGRATSQIDFQDSSDKSEAKSTSEDNQTEQKGVEEKVSKKIK